MTRWEYKWRIMCCVVTEYFKILGDWVQLTAYVHSLVLRTDIKLKSVWPDGNTNDKLRPIAFIYSFLWSFETDIKLKVISPNFFIIFVPCISSDYWLPFIIWEFISLNIKWVMLIRKKEVLYLLLMLNWLMNLNCCCCYFLLIGKIFIYYFCKKTIDAGHIFI